MAKDAPTNSDDIIDSRDIIARLDELTNEREGLVEASEDTDSTDEDKAKAVEALELWDDDNGEELKALQALCNEGEGYPDWGHGAPLIRDSYFEDYARELAEDLYGKELSGAHWPFDCIDWEKAADALKMDYGTVTFDGEEYWIRS